MVDPRLEQLDLLGGERFALVRHALVGIVAGDPADQFAVGTFAGDDGFFLQHIFTRIERKGAFVFSGRVALGAAGLEQRHDVVREIDLGRLALSRSSKKKQGNAREDGVPTVQQIW